MAGPIGGFQLPPIVNVGSAKPLASTTPAAEKAPVGDQASIDFSAAQTVDSNPRPSKLSPVSLDMMARMMASTILSCPMLAGPIGALGPVVTGQRANWDSGVFALDKAGVAGKFTDFSLPGNTTVTMAEGLITKGQYASAKTLKVVERDGKPVVEEHKLQTRVLPDKSVEVTNLNGTLTLLNPSDLSLRHQSGSV